MTDRICKHREQLVLSPNNGIALFELGRALLALGDTESGLQTISQSLIVDQENPEHYCLYGEVLLKLRKVFEAICAFRRALVLAPSSARAYTGLGCALSSQGDIELGLACFQKSWEHGKTSAARMSELAVAYCEAGEYERGLKAAEGAVELNPSVCQGYLAMVDAIFGIGNPKDAMAPIRTIISLDPANALGYHNQGRALLALNQVKRAESHFRRAIEIEPRFAEAHFGYAVCLLAKGHLRTGFEEYEWRFRLGAANVSSHVRLLRELPDPMWRGESLRGKTLLVHCEQGLGDTIQFIRFVPFLVSKGCQVILWGPRQLRRLLDGMPWLSVFVEPGQPLPTFDFHVALCSIPRVIKTTIDTIPARIPYLSILPKNKRFRKPSSSSETHIAVFWKTKRLDCLDYRSIPSKELEILFTIPNTKFYDIDPKNAGACDYSDRFAQRFQNVTSLSSQIRDFADTASILSEMDIILSIDSAVAHLAGALGLNVWLILPRYASWRWLSKDAGSQWGARSPWYPTMRIFRSPKFNSWKEIITRMCTEIENFTKNRDLTS